MRKIFFILFIAFLYVLPAGAQQYKLKQSTGMMGMKTETTIYVKGMRKRTETGSTMGLPPRPVEIQQCDLQRTVKLNDKKKLYYIEPFRSQEEISDDQVKAAKTKLPDSKPRKGGTIYNYYHIKDTGERKKIHGFTARHIWTTRRMVPSADACMMKDSMIIKTDGWYIDLPEFNCPVNNGGYYNGGMGKLDCMDRFVTKQTGKGKLGFPLTETTTMIMGGQTSEFNSSMETIELSTAKLDSMLFEIPPGYTQTMNEEDLQEKMGVEDMMKQYSGKNTDGGYNNTPAAASGPKPAGIIRIGVYPLEGGADLLLAELQQFLAGTLMSDGVQAVVADDEADAKSKDCDYVLSTNFARIKQGSKLGGILKAVKNADPGASSTYNIDTEMTLTKLADGNTVAEPRTAGKYEGKVNDAAKRNLEDGAKQVLKALR